MMVGDIFMEGWPHRGLSIYTIVSDMKNLMSFEENCITYIYYKIFSSSYI